MGLQTKKVQDRDRKRDFEFKYFDDPSLFECTVAVYMSTSIMIYPQASKQRVKIYTQIFKSVLWNALLPVL